MSSLKGLDHIGVAVKDLALATKTYGAMGLELLAQESLEDRGLEISFMGLANTKIELLAALRDDAEISQFLAKRGEGIHHLCFEVEDLEKAVQEVENQGLRLVSEIRPGAHNTRVAFLHPKSTHGVLVELMEKK